MRDHNGGTINDRAPHHRHNAAGDHIDGHWVHDPGGYVQHDQPRYEYVHHRPVVAPHDPTLDHLHHTIHQGAVHIIDDYVNGRGYDFLVAHARRILEHDDLNARHHHTHRAEQYHDDLVRAVTALAEHAERASRDAAADRE